ncbi:hypothetical protein Nepgr_008835 [Nepenthes gracilis]|uniref:Uncharacterized protein n=1 Tax=Nepenthes gracilis TaxID=150966 RepID=A0AAD3S9E3_NEPGR|nr:hypothetical protein Nepgr_008835 [Nepenthes gracilis]
MESRSPRSRIDQFYCSKKKRASSPATTSAGIERNVTSRKEASPSAKGSLDNYLVTSQADDLSTRQGPFKRNLTLEIGSLTKCEGKEPIFLNEGSSVSLASSVAVSREVVSGGLVGASHSRPGGSEKDNSDLAHGQQRPELEQFATDFLSLYCSDLSSSLLPEQISNENKRQGSPSVLAMEDKESKKRCCISDTDQSQLVESTSCNKAKSDLKPLGIVTEESPTVKSVHATLRKCSRTTNTAADMTECSTPGLLPANSRPVKLQNQHAAVPFSHQENLSGARQFKLLMGWLLIICRH